MSLNVFNTALGKWYIPSLSGGPWGGGGYHIFIHPKGEAASRSLSLSAPFEKKSQQFPGPRIQVGWFSPWNRRKTIWVTFALIFICLYPINERYIQNKQLEVFFSAYVYTPEV